MPHHYDQSPLTDDNSSLIALCLHPRLRRVRQQQHHSFSVNVHQAVFLHRWFFPHIQNGTTNNHRHFLIRLKSGNQCFLVNVKWQLTMQCLFYWSFVNTETPVRGSSNDILHSPAVSRSPQQTALEGGKLEIQILIGLNGFLFHYSLVPPRSRGRVAGDLLV